MEENQFWLLFTCSLSLFLICNMLLFYCVGGRIKSVINTEREHARRTAQNPQYGKEIAMMIQIVGVFLATSFSLTTAAAVASFTVDKKRPASTVVFFSSALPTLCFALVLKMLDEAAKSDAHNIVRLEALLFKAFVICRVGYRLFFFTSALCMGWIQSILMFVATVVLVLIYIIIDVRTFIVSHQTIHIHIFQNSTHILPLSRENPIRNRILHVQVREVALLLQNQLEPSAGRQ